MTSALRSSPSRWAQQRLRPPAEGALIGRSLAVLATLLLLGIGGFVGYYDAQYATLSAALDADLGTYRRLHWSPPVVRGTPGEGNAADDIYTALLGFPELSGALREGLAERIHYGKPLQPEELAKVQEHATVLAAVRAATQHGSSITTLAPERGELMRVPAYPRIMDAALLLLGATTSAAADECLRTTSDVIRIGQAIVPGAPLEAASVSMRMTSLAASAISHCLLRADATATRRAAHELMLLASHPPPTGGGIELLDLVTASKLRRRAGLTNKQGAAEVLDTVKHRPDLLRTWELYFTDPTRFRKITPEAYPDAIDLWKREQDMRLQSTLPYVAQDAAGVMDLLYDDMRGHAILRALAIGVSTLAERTVRGRWPAEPIGLVDPKLADPFRGKSFNFRYSDDGSELTVWSVGEDLRDDRGSSEWGASGPTDVTLHFRRPPTK